MQRVIKFRGRCGNGKWEIGDLITTMPGSPLILNERGTWAVDPDTVGQFTGQQDKNGVDIYEGDIIKAVIPRRGIWSELTLANGAVYYVGSSFRVSQNEHSGSWVRLDSLSPDVEIEVEVIDNPDLLEVTP